MQNYWNLLIFILNQKNGACSTGLFMTMRLQQIVDLVSYILNYMSQTLTTFGVGRDGSSKASRISQIAG